MKSKSKAKYKNKRRKAKKQSSYIDRLAPTFLTLFFIAVLARSFLLVKYNFDFEAAEILRGISSDFYSCFLLALPLALIPRFGAYVAAFIAAFIFSANIEHVIYNSANFNLLMFKYAAHPQFITGSILTYSYASKLFILLALGAAFAYAAIPYKSRFNKVIFVLFVISLVNFPFLNNNRWPNTNVLESSVKNVLGRIKPEKITNSEEELAIINKVTARDLNGEKFYEIKNGAKPNIIVIVVESMNSLLIHPQVMPHLYKLKEENIFYPNFIAPGKLTNNGLYSIFCGDLPNIISFNVKPEIVSVRHKNIKCLPEEIKKLGYNNEFMQSSDLGYMNKEPFLKIAGFDEIHGFEYFSQNVLKNTGWGISDAVLFAKAKEEIKKQKAPFFFAILNTGSHPPYNEITKEYLKYFNPKDDKLFEETGEEDYLRLSSYRLIDDKIKELLDNLKASGLLKNSIVVITADESGAKLKASMDSLINGNTVPLIIITPEGVKKRNAGIFTQADLLISFAELLGLDTENMKGRSVFREYKEQRPLVFSHTNQQNAYLINEGRITNCNFTFDCSSYSFTGDVLDKAEFKTSITKSSEKNIIKGFAQKNDWDFGENENVITIDNQNYTGKATIIGDLKVHVQKGDVLKFVMDAEGDNSYLDFRVGGINLGMNNLRADITQYIKINNETHFEKVIKIPDEKFLWLRLMTTEDKKSILIKRLTVTRIKN